MWGCWTITRLVLWVDQGRIIRRSVVCIRQTMFEWSHLWTCRPERWCSLRGLTREASVCELIIRDRPTHAPLRALLKLLTTVELMLVNMVMVKMSAIPSVDMLTTEDFVLCSSNNIMRTPYSETSWQFAKYGRRVLLYTWCSLLLSVLIALLMVFMAFIYSNGIVINHRLVISLHTQIRVPTVSDRAP